MLQANCSKLSLSSENVPIYVFNNVLFHVERKPMRSLIGIFLISYKKSWGEFLAIIGTASKAFKLSIL